MVELLRFVMRTLVPLNRRKHVDRSAAACLVADLLRHGQRRIRTVIRRREFSILEIRPRDEPQELCGFQRRGCRTIVQSGLVKPTRLVMLAESFEGLSLGQYPLDRKRGASDAGRYRSENGLRWPHFHWPLS